MEEQNVRKTYKYKLNPTAEHVRALERALWRCCELYNAGLQERKEAWEQCHVSVNFAMQSAQLPDIKAMRPNTGTSMPRYCKMSCIGSRRPSRPSSAGETPERRRAIPGSIAAPATPASPIPSLVSMAVPDSTTASWCSPRWAG